MASLGFRGWGGGQTYRLWRAREREPINKRVWGLCPQWGPGAKPLVRGSGGLRIPETKAFLALKINFHVKMCQF